MQTHNIEKSKTPVPHTSRTILLAAALAFAAIAAQATTYYWKPGTTQGLWTDLSNWSTAGIGGADASALPGSSDDLYGDGDYNFDLEGSTNTLHKILEPTNDDIRYLTITNGTLKFTSEVRRFSSVFNIDSGATIWMLSGSTFYPGAYAYHQAQVNVNDGGSLIVEGLARFYHTKYNVNAGGVCTFNPTSIQFNESNVNGMENIGTLSLPGGIVLNGSVIGSPTFNVVSAGTLNLGGSFNGNGKTCSFNVVFSGGTVNVTGDVTFNVTSATVTNSVEFKVASGKTLNLTPVTFAAGSSITKTGDGSVVLPTTGATATISAGSVALSAATYDFSGVTFGTGATISLASLGGRINSADPSIANATFVATIPASAGTAVFYSTDATLLAKVKTDLDASVPEGFDLVVSGEELSVEAETAASFTVTGDITAAAGWGGAVPAAGSDVAIDGADVVATLPSSGVLPAWNSIEVKNGATLRIEADATLPAIILNKNATLEIGGNATVTMADLTGAVATSPSLVVPGLTVESGATLNVPGGMKFSNVDIDLEGTIAATTEGGIVFGYAAAGDTTYIGLAVHGGTISLTAGSGSYDASPLEFCCPASGGTVVAVGDLTLTDASILPVYVSSSVTYTFTESYKYGFHLGVNNPTNELFEVVFDGTQWGVCGKTIIKGGATFRLVNGSTYKEYETHTLWNRTGEISEMGRVVVGTGCEFRLPAMGDYGNKALEINPGYAGHQAVVVEDGGVFETYRSSGNGKGVLAVSNGVYQVYLPWTTNASFAVVASNVPFEGLAAVEVADGSTLTFSTRNRVFWNPGQFHNDSGERVVALADVPIRGGGSIALDNANVNVFGVIVQSGTNTATGTASVVAPTEGEGATTLYFANGANWAGTVVAGNVALTNLVDAAAASTNAFGTLALVENFPVRVWTDENGRVVSHDGLNVDTYVKNGGKLELVVIGAPLVERFSLGTIGEESPLPDVQGPWAAKRGQDGTLLIKPGSGMQVFVR